MGMLSNNRIELNENDIPVQTISFGKSSFTIDSTFDEQKNLDVVLEREKEMNQEIISLKKNIKQISNQIHLLNNNNESQKNILLSIDTIDQKINDLNLRTNQQNISTSTTKEEEISRLE